MRYAEHLRPEQRAAFRRVAVTRDFHKLTGYWALEGAIGYVVSENDGRLDVVFERSSADRVKSNMVGQCGLTDIDPHHVSDAPDTGIDA